MSSRLKMEKFFRSSYFIIGLALTASVVTYIYRGHQVREQCQIELKQTIRSMEISIGVLKAQLEDKKENEQKRLQDKKEMQEQMKKEIQEQIEKALHPHHQTFINTLHFYKQNSMRLKYQLVYQEIS